MKPDEIKEVVGKWYKHIAAKGGASRSEAKRAAGRANVAKARLKRWPKAPPQEPTCQD